VSTLAVSNKIHWCLAVCAVAVVVRTASNSQISVQNRDFCLPQLHSTPPLGPRRQNIAMTFGIEKLEWCGYSTVKSFWRYVYSFWQNVWTWQTDSHTDGRTDRHRHRPHKCIASHGNKINRWQNGNLDSINPFEQSIIHKLSQSINCKDTAFSDALFIIKCFFINRCSLFRCLSGYDF